MTRYLFAIVGAAIALSACGQPGDPSPAETDSTTKVADAVDTSSSSASGAGVVTAVDAAAGTVTIDHEAIPAVGWPAMTMSFAAKPAVLQQAVVGNRVDFDLTVRGNSGEITSIRPQ